MEHSGLTMTLRLRVGVCYIREFVNSLVLWYCLLREEDTFLCGINCIAKRDWSVSELSRGTTLLGSDTFVPLDLGEQTVHQFPSDIVTSLIISGIGLLYYQCPNIILEQERQY